MSVCLSFCLFVYTRRLLATSGGESVRRIRRRRQTRRRGDGDGDGDAGGGDNIINIVVIIFPSNAKSSQSRSFLMTTMTVVAIDEYVRHRQADKQTDR
ncbi:hypothetical protein IWX46DRAFT_18384 [Phyllosticta citricarpa]|uniref:Secreted protein n=1 Tax=Phyllosticta citricarpa TaxID=55181 RepID=A0ABR1MSW4_9PEZI